MRIESNPLQTLANAINNLIQGATGTPGGEGTIGTTTQALTSGPGDGYEDAGDAEVRARLNNQFNGFDIEGDTDMAMELAGDKKSLENMNRNQRLALVQNLFDGYTNGDEEIAAKDILLSAESAEELQWLIDKLGGWDEIRDELDDPEVGAIMQKLGQLQEAQPTNVTAIFNEFTPLNIDTLREYGPDDQTLEKIVRAKLDKMSPKEIEDLSQRILQNKDAVLNEISNLRRRGKESNANELEDVVRWVSERAGGDTKTKLQFFAHEVRYTNEVAANLEDGDYAQLLKIVPKLADPDLSREERIALFEALRRLKPELQGMKEVMEEYGSPVERENLRRFTNVMDTLMNEFDPNLPQPALLKKIADALKGSVEGVVDSFESLKLTLGNLADDLKGTVTLGHILGTDDDDKARELVSKLKSKGLLEHIPTDSKTKLINAMLDGFTGDEDETAILDILEATKANDPAEYYQLVTSVGFENLDDSIQGDEWDRFLRIMNQ